MFAKPLSDNEKRIIRILNHSAKCRERSRAFSYHDIADALNQLLRDYNGGTRTKWGIISYLKRRDEN